MSVSEGMYEAVGVLQRDCPIDDNNVNYQRDLLVYQKLVEKYVKMVKERIDRAKHEIGAIPVTGESMEEKLERARLMPCIIDESISRLDAKLNSNQGRHAELAALFDQLVKGRYGSDPGRLHDTNSVTGEECSRVVDFSE